MGVEKVEFFNPSSLLDANVAAQVAESHAEGAQQADEIEKDDASRKAAEKKVATTQKEIKEGVKTREASNKDQIQQRSQTEQRAKAILGGAAGPEAANEFGTLQNNQQLQNKLSAAMKDKLNEYCANNVKTPQKIVDTAKTLNEAPKTEGFKKLPSTAVADLVDAAIKDPKTTKAATNEVLNSRFAKAKNSDSKALGQFMQFGREQIAKGNQPLVRNTGDMLSSLAGAKASGVTQQLAMKTVATTAKTNPEGATKAANNLDTLAKDGGVKGMPSFGRNELFKGAARKGGSDEVTSTYTQFAGDKNVQKQSASIKNRSCELIGKYPELAGPVRGMLSSPQFPKRPAQQEKAFQLVGMQAQKGGPTNVNTGEAMQKAKTSGLPPSPKFTSTEGLEGEDLVKARSQNRAAIMQYFHQYNALLDGTEKKYNKAKYFEDMSGAQMPPDLPDVDTSSLSPEELAFYAERKEVAKERRAKLQQLNRTKSRELRNKRMPPAKRRAMQAERRAVGRQPKYFNPNAPGATGPRGNQTFGRVAVGAESTTPLPRQSALPTSPQRAGYAKGAAGTTPGSAAFTGRATGGASFGGGTVDAQVANIVAQLKGGPVTAEAAQQIASAIAANVATQVAQQLMSATQPAVAEVATASTGDVGGDDGPVAQRLNALRNQGLSEEEAVMQLAAEGIIPRDRALRVKEKIRRRVEAARSKRNS